MRNLKKTKYGWEWFNTEIVDVMKSEEIEVHENLIERKMEWAESICDEADPSFNLFQSSHEHVLLNERA